MICLLKSPKKTIPPPPPLKKIKMLTWQRSHGTWEKAVCVEAHLESGVLQSPVALLPVLSPWEVAVQVDLCPAMRSLRSCFLKNVMSKMVVCTSPWVFSFLLPNRKLYSQLLFKRLSFLIKLYQNKTLYI